MKKGNPHNLQKLWALLLTAVFLALGATPIGRRLGRTLMSSFVNVIYWTGIQGGRLWHATPWCDGWRSEKQILETRIAELEAELVTYARLNRENDELRRLLKLEPRTAWHGIFAAIVSREPMEWDEGFLLNKGTSDGIYDGLVVLADGFVVGRIVECQGHTSRVALLGSSGCRFSVSVGLEGPVGVLNGADNVGGDITFLVDFLPKDTNFDEDTIFYTTGIGSWMPAGLPVGQIHAEEDSSFGREIDHARLCLRGTPLLNLKHLHFVVVLSP